MADGLSLGWLQDKQATSLSAPKRNSNRQAGRRVHGNLQLRSSHGGENRSYTQQSTKPLSEEHSDLIHAELENGRNVRDYLREWYKSHPELAAGDPIHIPDPEGRKAWIGNMLCEEIVHSTKLPDRFEMERYQYAADDLEDSHFLYPGDLVLLKSDSGVADGQLAIYIRSVDFQQQFYTCRGKWRIAHPKDVDLIASRLVTPDMIAPIVRFFPPTKVVRGPLPQLAMEGGVPRELGASLLDTMDEFETTAQETYRDHADVLDNIYNKLADDQETLTMTLDEIASKALDCDPGSLTDPVRYAIHKAILRRTFYITPNQSYSVAESYTIKPRWQADVVDTVINWAREYQQHQQNQSVGRRSPDIANHPIEQFLRKARRIILRSRQTRSPTMVFALGPTSKRFSPEDTEDGMAYSKVEVESFSKTDQTILDYLRLWLQPPLLMKAGILRTPGSLILRNTGMYDQLPLIPATGYLFLQELGVFAPWENLHVQTMGLTIPKETALLSSQTVEDTDIKLVDSMEHLRKDWGDLPVFCIDSEHASEIDDGVSLERIEGSNDTFWMHIHVANPSAFIPPDHALADRASKALTSMYTPERVYPMLPPSLMHSRFSLAPGRPTLTFSAKINLSGEILDTHITNGFIRNVVYITPDTLRKFFGADRAFLPSLTIRVGGNMKGPPRSELQGQIERDHQDLFRMMEKLMSARREQRLKNGLLDVKRFNPCQPLVYGGKNDVSTCSPENSNACHYLGDPVIQLTGQVADPFQAADPTKDDLVAHMMQLAGEVSAQWCKDRGIPLMFSGTVYHPEHKPPSKEDMATAQDASFILGLPRSITSSKPITHAALGLEHYTKCTSPLRRYSDLLAHWQIEAALRYEAENGSPLVASSNPGVLPFTENDIDGIISRSGWQNMLIKRAQNRSRDFWTCQLLFRAFYFGETQLPKTFRCIINEHVDDRGSPLVQEGLEQYIGTILPFGWRCFVALDKGTPSVQRGDIVDVELSYIDVYYLTIIVRMDKLVERPPPGALAGFM